jgi:hypothetical protein
MKYLLYIILLLLLASCGQRFHVKRAKHHMDKALQKGAHIGTDSTFIERKIKIEGVKVRFIPKPIFPNQDTIYFEKQKVVTKVLLRHDSIFVETNCPDTVFHFKERTITKTITAINKSWLKWWMLLIAAMLGAILFGILKR